jgi:hypothetical protein
MSTSTNAAFSHHPLAELLALFSPIPHLKSAHLNEQGQLAISYWNMEGMMSIWMNGQSTLVADFESKIVFGRVERDIIWPLTHENIEQIKKDDLQFDENLYTRKITELEEKMKEMKLKNQADIDSKEDDGVVYAVSTVINCGLGREHSFVSGICQSLKQAKILADKMMREDGSILRMYANRNKLNEECVIDETHNDTLMLSCRI